MCLLEYFRRAEEQGKPHFYLRVCIRAFVYIYIYTNNYIYVMLYIYIYIIVNTCTFISTAMSYRYSMIIAKKVIIGDHWRSQSNWNLWD